MSAASFLMSDIAACVGRVAILWRGDEEARRNALPETSRFKAIFTALGDVGVDAEPVVYEDDVSDEVGAELATFDGVLVWVNPIHDGRNRANLNALLREVAARGVWVSAHPDVILKMGTKEVLYHTRMMSWGGDTALYATAETMREQFPSRLAGGPRVIKRNRGNGGQGVWKVELLSNSETRPIVRVLDATKDASEEVTLDEFLADILYLGGVSRTLRVCAMASAAGLPVTPHSANLGMVTLFTMHLLRAIECAGKYLEFSIEGPDYYPWQEGLFVKSPYDVEDGMVSISDEPGWGVEIDPEWLAKSDYQVSEAEG